MIVTDKQKGWERSSYTLIFEDDFDSELLDQNKWLEHYLPHWSERERTRPRYDLANGCLTLRIDPDQLYWCPEFDPDVKVSNLQTGQFSGPIESRFGQHRFSPTLMVREAQERQELFLSQFGYFEIRARADISANNLVALWLIGLEDVPERSGEICVVEIKGWEIEPSSTLLGYGIKPWYDPTLEPGFHEDRLGFNVSDFHVYGMDWSEKGIDVFLDGVFLRHIAQSPNYPMQMMLNIYELPNIPGQPRDKPASFSVDYVRVWQKTKLK